MVKKRWKKCRFFGERDRAVANALPKLSLFPLFSLLQVAEAANQFGLVLHVGRNLEPPHAEHGLEEAHQLAARRGDGGGGGVDAVRFVGVDLWGGGGSRRGGRSRRGVAL